MAAYVLGLLLSVLSQNMNILCYYTGRLGLRSRESFERAGGLKVMVWIDHALVIQQMLIGDDGNHDQIQMTRPNADTI